METSNRIVCGMVLGEASESDDDSDVNHSTAPTHDNFLPSHNAKKSPRPKLKYNTLLHYKLRESNISLRNNLVNVVEHPIQRANQQLQESIQLQTKTRAALHEMPRYLHQLSVALVGLQDRLPMMCNVNLIPNSGNPATPKN